MKDKRLFVALVVLLSLAAAVALAGAVAVALGEGAGIIALVIGLAACFPVLGELYRQSGGGRPARPRHSGKDR